MMRDEALEFVKAVWERYWSYHNWKETGAWSGVGLHLVFVGLFVRAAPACASDIVRAIVLNIASVILGWLAILYVRAQHRLTAQAARVNSACGRLWAKLLSMPSGPLGADWSLEIASAGDFGPSHMLPLFISDEARKIETPRGRQQLARLALWLLGMGVVFSIVMIWLPWIKALTA